MEDPSTGGGVTATYIRKFRQNGILALSTRHTRCVLHPQHPPRLSSSLEEVRSFDRPTQSSGLSERYGRTGLRGRGVSP
ncbi:unnamed protein product [Gadus morhua 'NCC']